MENSSNGRVSIRTFNLCIRDEVCIRVGIPKGGVHALRLYYALRSSCNNKSTDSGVCRECEWDRRRAQMQKQSMLFLEQTSCYIVKNRGQKEESRNLEKKYEKYQTKYGGGDTLPDRTQHGVSIVHIWKICVEKRNYVNATRITQLFVSTFSEENDDTHV